MTGVDGGAVLIVIVLFLVTTLRSEPSRLRPVSLFCSSPGHPQGRRSMSVGV